MKSYKHKVFVIKLSGKIAGDDRVRPKVCEQIRRLVQSQGCQVVIVHGGGKQLDSLAAKLKVPQTIIRGRRVTDAKTLDLATMVFSGKINLKVHSDLKKQGLKSIGISGPSGGIVTAEIRPPKKVAGFIKKIDFGLVGDIVSIDTPKLFEFINLGFIPVVSAFGTTRDGQIVNINADTIAIEIATAMKAHKVFILSDTDAIYRDINDPETKIDKMTLDEIERFIDCGHAIDGMIPKLQACLNGIQNGLPNIRIASGRNPDIFRINQQEQNSHGTLLTSN